MGPNYNQEIVMRGWAGLVQAAGKGPKNPAGVRWMSAVREAYGSGGRHYHDMTHLAELLDHFEIHRAKLQNPARVLAAIFFHDIVYRAEKGLPAGTSERESAAVATAALTEMGFKADFVQSVHDLIIATATHKIDPKSDPDGALFLDMDMAILGADPARYRTYCAQVRREYAAYSDAEFTFGRLNMFVGPVLAGGSPFLTDVFRRRYDRQARANLTEEQGRLKAALGRMGPRP